MTRKEYNAQYYTEHKKEVKQQQAGYRLEHREERKAYFVKFYRDNRNRRKAVAAQYQKEHPEQCRGYRAKRRAAKTEAGGSYTPTEWLALCKKFKHRCARCKRRRKLEADHVIPIHKGGTSSIDNIQPLCRSCNAIKHTKCTDFRRT
jgi:5-methylcytosine-specific restriction endonuclease McrA